MGKLTITYAKKWENRMNEVLNRTILPSQVFPLSLLAYPKAQGHSNDPSVLLHSEFGLFPQVWLPVAHSSISER